MKNIMNNKENICKGEILVVDDIPANLKLLMDLLTSQGYKVRPAIAGEQALSAIKMRKPDLILLDVKMPGMDGYQVCQHLKKNKQTAEIPVIFISALGSLKDRIRGFEEGGVDYITKPFQREEVLVRVHTHIQLYRMQQDLELIVAERTQDLQQAISQLRKSETQLKQAQAIGHIGNWELILSNSNVLWSEEVYHIMGVEPQKFVPNFENFLSLAHPDDRAALRNVIDKAINGVVNYHEIEYRILQPDGTERTILTSGKLHSNEKGEPVSIFGVVQDITEHKLAEDQKHQSAMQLHNMLLQTIEAISMTVEKRDPYTAGHQRRVSLLAVAIAKEMRLNENTIEGIRLGAMIHDLGKISIPSEILSKPGQLSSVEFALIKLHPDAGYEIVKEIDFPWPVAEMIRQHHERLNGTGYPSGLSGNEIIIEAQILAVADVVEAMASHRPYRPSQGIKAALDEISKNKGINYETTVVDACLKIFAEKRFEFEEYSDSL